MNQPWYDPTSGVVQGFQGGVFGPVNGIYYWVGMDMRAADQIETTAPLLLYSSTDLYRWTLAGPILQNPGYASLSRTHIIHNEATGQYVLWSHCVQTVFSGPQTACIATASAITGPWTWQRLGYDPGLGLKDMNLFVDDDGTGYVVYTTGCQCQIVTQQLAPDYLSAIGSTDLVAFGGIEAPVLFKRGSTYFLIYGNSTQYSSDTWDTDPHYLTASSPLGGWGGGGRLFPTDPFGTPFGGQPTAVFKVAGKQDGWVYMADYWRTPVWNSTHLWLPLTFSDATHAQVQTPAVWDLSYFP